MKRIATWSVAEILSKNNETAQKRAKFSKEKYAWKTRLNQGRILHFEEVIRNLYVTGRKFLATWLYGWKSIININLANMLFFYCLGFINIITFPRFSSAPLYRKQYNVEL